MLDLVWRDHEPGRDRAIDQGLAPAQVGIDDLLQHGFQRHALITAILLHLLDIAVAQQLGHVSAGQVHCGVAIADRIAE